MEFVVTILDSGVIAPCVLRIAVWGNLFFEILLQSIAH